MGYVKCTAQTKGNKCGKNRRTIVSVVNDVNLLLKQRENEKSRPKVWNHQLQQFRPSYSALATLRLEGKVLTASLLAVSVFNYLIVMLLT